MKIFTALLFVTNFIFAQWQSELRLTNTNATSMPGQNNAKCIVSNGNNVTVLFASSRDGNYEIYSKRSLDAGSSWENDMRLTNSPDSSIWPAAANDGSTIHVVWQDKRDGNNEIYYKKSVDNGATWSADYRITTNLFNSSAPSLFVSGAFVHITWVDIGSGVKYRRSLNSGNTWENEIVIKSSAEKVKATSVSGSGANVHVIWLYKEPADGKYYVYHKKSTDNGTNWGTDLQIHAEGSLDWNPPSICVSGSDIYIARQHRNTGSWIIYFLYSSNGGSTWGNEMYWNIPEDQVGPNICAYGNNVHLIWFEGPSSNMQIYYRRSIDKGLTWSSNFRVTNTATQSVIPNLCLSGTYVHTIWFDTRHGNGEVYYRNNPTGNPIGINIISSQIPGKFNLHQNYPNPFNPVTKIRFDIPRSENVIIKVYDMLGKEITTLVDQQLQPGTYETDWDASLQSSGIYYYKIIAGNYTETKKMVLIR